MSETASTPTPPPPAPRAPEIDRRAFLVRTIQLALTATTIDALLPRWALAQAKKAKKDARAPGRTLVAIFLRGGCDALNMVIPYRDPAYHKVRPTIGIAPKDAGQERGAIPLTRLFGLHPALEALVPLWERGRFAPIVNVGSPHPSRSHFDCMDFMEYAAPGDRTVTQGWLNRFAELTAGGAADASRLRAVAMQGLLPRALRGPYPALAVPPLREGAGKDPLEAFDEAYPGMADAGDPGTIGGAPPPAPTDPVIIAGRNTIDQIRRFRAITETPAPGEGRARYPAHPFGKQLQQLARVVKSDAGLELACIDYPGWDHHAREGGAEGTMAQMLRVLAEGLAAFAEDLGDAMERVVVLTMSEFGRTVKENGTEGTDHGHGGIMFALGGPAKGGKVYGGWSGLAEASLFEGRDLPVHTDFRVVFAETLEGVFGWRPPDGFFPNFRVPPGQRLRLFA